MPKGVTQQIILVMPKSKFEELRAYICEWKRVTDKQIAAHQKAFGEEVVVLKVLP